WLQNVSFGDGVSLPFLPIRCFRTMNVSRYLDHELAASRNIVTFRSSGSTNVTRASHHLGLSGLQSYEKSAVEGFFHAASRLGIPLSCPIISLVPKPEQWPDSSLAKMLAFWSAAGMNVQYIDIESDPGALKDSFSRQTAKETPDEIVIFGTSLHLLTIAQWQSEHNLGRPFIFARKVWFFDTGGTKGRTQHTSPAALQAMMRSWTAPECATEFLSEYGMCELSSQAYSLEANRNGSFHCSPTLRSVILDTDLKSPVSPGKAGFLAFVDLANVDSWPFIITEDIAQHLDSSSRVFQLLGRAPDATVKGCSLNVRANFRFDLKQVNNPKEKDSPSSKDVGSGMNGNSSNGVQTRSLFEGEDLLTSLRGNTWTNKAIENLRSSFAQWRNRELEDELTSESALRGKSIAVTASANIPVTWLFPAVHAWLMGAQAVDIFLPSPRQDDPVSNLVREQIQTLADSFNACTQVDFVRIHNHRLPMETTADQVLVFGHDETLKAIRTAFYYAEKQTRLVGFGHFQNAIKLRDDDTAHGIAKITSSWLGRGCLTPLFAIVPEQWSSSKLQNFVDDWSANAAMEMSSSLPADWQDYQRRQFAFAHRHNLAELKATTLLHSIPLRIVESSASAIVGLDFEGFRLESLPSSTLDDKILDWGGCGWLSFLKPSQLTDRLRDVACETSSPGLWDLHQGKFWRDWLNDKKSSPN
ncbi:hypothetical protein EBR21_09380, partial [bacterium]|nr:hypothetical protein [bacterium]